MVAGSVSASWARDDPHFFLQDHFCKTTGLNMTNGKAIIVTMSLLLLSALAVGQSSASPRITPADAKKHVGETATVCGKVVDNQVSKYGIGGHGKPVTFDLDEPQPNPVFYFVTFGNQPDGPSEAVAAYQGKHVCVTGKIATAASGPYMMAADRNQIKVDADK
jgi:hypothetical protein